MNHNGFSAFMRKLESDPTVLAELDQLLARSVEQRTITVSEIAALGGRHGYRFTEADIMACEPGDELSAAELEAISGGAQGRLARCVYTISLNGRRSATGTGDESNAATRFRIRGD